MLHRKLLKMVLPIFAAGCLSPAISNAQLTVLANGNAGIGNAAPVQKLDVVVNAADPATEAGRFANNSTTASVKYGIRNTVSNAGTSSRYGIYNDVQSLSTASVYSYGIYNNVNSGTAGSYGLYNYQNSGGTGFKYGQLNYTFQNSTSTTLSLGIYNYTTSYLGYSYGLYNYQYIGSTTTANANTQYNQYNSQFSYGTGTHYGIYNYVTAGTTTTAGTRYGVYTEVANTGTGIRYGIFSRSLGTANYAGYFDGNVHVNGVLTSSSDDKLKTNIAPVKNAIALVKQIDPKTYQFRKDISGMSMPVGDQIGLLASNVEKVLPELVSEVKAPLNNAAASQVLTPEEQEKRAKNGEAPQLVQQNGETYYTYKSVNYIGMIPVLLQAIKDQQQMIEQLQQQVQEQKAVISQLKPASK